MNHLSQLTCRALILLLAGGLGLATAEESSFYKETQLFSTAPDPHKSLQMIDRFGPVGIGIELHQPAFVMKVKNVEEGSPAAAAGKLKKGQVIETINGQKLADIDPRIQLGRILAQAEATDGLIKFAIKGEAQPITVKIPVLGAYSKTWPMNCPKSDKIVRQVADYLSGPKANKGFAGVGMLFLLSTGEDKDLEVVRQWAREVKAHTYPWYIGYGGIPLAECYLRTGDKKILENIQEWVDNAAKSQHNDAWSGRGSALAGYGAGHLNAGGTHVLTFLLLAKECGANVPDHTLHGALKHFYRYAGRGNNPYGDHRPFTGFVDNGKNGLLAIAMAAAASLTPDGEDSLYAKARDICAMFSFYSTTYMLHGHTGGGIGEIWRSAAMGLLHDKKPGQYREFMDNRQWHYDLSRRWDGSFGILQGADYDKEEWGMAYTLAYTMPRKTLRISGAPRSKFSKPYQLPKQAWGNEADNAFLLFDAVPDKDGNKQDLSGETLARDASKPFIARFNGPAQPSDDEIRKYIHHKDPRVRGAMFTAVVSYPEMSTTEIFELAVQAVKDPKESWTIKDMALQIIGVGSADQVVPLVDLLLPYLKHEESWLRNAALTALTPVAADVRCYQKVLPAIGELLQTNQRESVTIGFAPAIRGHIKNAGPAVQQLAIEILKENLTGYAGKEMSPEGQNLKSTYDYHLRGIATSLADVPGGYDVLYAIAREKHPDVSLPYADIFLGADFEKFGPELKKAIGPIILNQLVGEYVNQHRRGLDEIVSGDDPKVDWRTMDGLIALYNKVGVTQYNWQVHGPKRGEMKWHYHSFMPPEKFIMPIAGDKIPGDDRLGRYRDISFPKGMDNWFAADFDPVKAGWKSGLAPFGSANGKLATPAAPNGSKGCIHPFCGCGEPINTLWEKDVLLLRGTFTFPKLEENHCYRLIHGGISHVGAGGGYRVYVNGKLFGDVKSGVDRRDGNKAVGQLITKEWRPQFGNGPTTISVLSFMKHHPRTKAYGGNIMISMEKMKIPPLPAGSE